VSRLLIATREPAHSRDIGTAEHEPPVPVPCDLGLFPRQEHIYHGPDASVPAMRPASSILLCQRNPSFMFTFSSLWQN